jgi:hypothetical protein
MATPGPGSRRTRRTAAKVAVFLLLGAVVNVAVAWGCVAWCSTNSVGPIDHQPVIDWFNANLPDSTATRWDVAICSQFSGRGLDTVWAAAAGLQNGDDPSNPQRMVMAHRYRAGIPYLSVEGEEWDFWNVLQDGRPGPHSFVIRGLLASVQGGALRAIKGYDSCYPYRPFLLGFAINTLFYGGILWLLFAAPFALRKWRRGRKGLCPACAYPVGTSEVCTECGAKVQEFK